jgi:phenylacetate-CoA ligase
MFCFGHITSEPLTAERAALLVEQCRTRQAELASTPLARILAVLEQLASLWSEDSPWFRRTVDALEPEIGFSRPMIEHTLRLLPGLLHSDELRARLTQELGSPELVDDYVRPAGFPGRMRAFPLGTLLHVTAGNVFLGGVDSLLMGFLTKNVSIMRVSSRNQSFPLLFAESLTEADPDGVIADKFCVVHWPAQDKEVEAAFKRDVDAILAWGGQSMLDSYGQGLGRGVRLLDFGPKISVQVIFDEALRGMEPSEAGQRIARDVCTWDQSACSSPQNLFCQRGTDIDALVATIATGLRSFPMARGPVSDDEAVEVWKERQRGTISRLLDGGDEVAGEDFYIHVDPAADLRPSPLQRTLIVKQFRDIDDLTEQLRPGRAFLQSCGYLARGVDKTQLFDRLGALGVCRFARLGDMTTGMTGAPHDGRHVLRDLVRLVVDETESSGLGVVEEAAEHVPLMRELVAGKMVARLNDAPLTSGATLLEHPLPDDRALIDERAREGIIFASGGTSGSPKFVWYSPAELDDTAAMLAHAFRAQGLEPGDVVANLFAAGNLWASFLAVHKALEKCGVVQLPIGAAAEHDAVNDTLTRFQPRAVFGMPTVLAEHARWGLEHGVNLTIPEVFYAGEHITASARDLLGRAWGARAFHSAGYASVDAGPIGYPCRHCTGAEHHLFSRWVHLEVIEGEAVVTSKVRRLMPIIRYRTGDRVEVIEEPCACGSGDLKFLLRGRVDGVINVWACRVTTAAVEQAIVDIGIDAPVFQMVLPADAPDGRELLHLRVVAPTNPALADGLRQRFYARNTDVAATHEFAWIAERLRIELVSSADELSRTTAGKIPRVVDQRPA